MIRGKSLISFSVSLHIMAGCIWDICYQLCCHSLSNFEPVALPHQCGSSPNPFTSSSSSKVISWEIFTLHFHEKLLLWAVTVFSEEVFLNFGGTRCRLSGILWWCWWPTLCGFITSCTQCLIHTHSKNLIHTHSIPCAVQDLPCDFVWFLSKAFAPNHTSTDLLPPSLLPLIPAEPEAIESQLSQSHVVG